MTYPTNMDVVQRAARAIQRAGRNYIAKRARTQPFEMFSQRSAASTQRVGRAPSRTTTQLTQREHAQADPVGGSLSRFSLVKPKVYLAGVDSMTAPQMTVNNESGRLTSTVGQQNAALLLTDFAPVDVVALFNNTLGAANKTTKCLIKSVNATIMIANQENVACHYTLYDILAKRDGNATITSPLVAFNAGLVDNAGGLASNYLIPGTDPYMSARFKEFFQVVKQTTGTLLPGSVHSHYVYYEPNKVISNEVSTFDASYIGGLTHYTMIVWHGTPINDSTTKTQVSIAPINLDFVVKQKRTSKIIYYPFQSTTVTQSLPLAFGVGGQVMNEFTDLPIAEGNA